MSIVKIGHGGYVPAAAIAIIVDPETAPLKRLIADARESNKLIDSTHGRRTRSGLRLNNGDLVLSAVQSSTLAGRYVEALNPLAYAEALSPLVAVEDTVGCGEEEEEWE